MECKIITTPTHSSAVRREVGGKSGWNTSHPCQPNVNLPLLSVKKKSWWWQEGRERETLNKGEGKEVHYTGHSRSDGHWHSAVVNSQQPTQTYHWCYSHSLWGQSLCNRGEEPRCPSDKVSLHLLSACPSPVTTQSLIMDQSCWHTSQTYHLCHTERTAASNWWTRFRQQSYWQTLFIQHKERFLGCHQPHAYPSLLVSSGSPSWQQTNGGGRWDWYWYSGSGVWLDPVIQSSDPVHNPVQWLETAIFFSWATCMSVHNEILIVDDHFNQTDQENVEKICMYVCT